MPGPDYEAGLAVTLYNSKGELYINGDGEYQNHNTTVPFCMVQKVNGVPVAAWRYCTDEVKPGCGIQAPQDEPGGNPKLTAADQAIIAVLINAGDQTTKRGRAILQTQVWCVSEDKAPGQVNAGAKDLFNHGVDGGVGPQFDDTNPANPESAWLTNAETTCPTSEELAEMAGWVPDSGDATFTFTSVVSPGQPGTGRFILDTTFVGSVDLDLTPGAELATCPEDGSGAVLSDDDRTLKLTRAGRVELCATRDDGGEVELKVTPHAVVSNSDHWLWNGEPTCQVFVDEGSTEPLPAQSETVVVTPAVAAAPAQPAVRTLSSAQVTGVGKSLHDTAYVTGLAPGDTPQATAKLFGPAATENGLTCTGRPYAEVPLAINGSGTFRTPDVRVNKPGWYTWQVTIEGGPNNLAVTEGCRRADETTLVSRPKVKAPVIPTGYDGVIDGPIARLITRVSGDSITINGSRTRANLLAVGVKRKTLSVPANVANVGWYRRTAHFGDVIGSAVVAGHVSDRVDSPGAFHRLKNLAKGEVITIKHQGVTYRYKVTGKRTYSRAKQLPRRLFSTTGPAQLHLVTCAGRRVRNGYFHYTKNLVVTAVPIS